MEIRGRVAGVNYDTVVAIVERVSAERYGGNVRVHQDARPIGSKRDGSRYGFTGRIDVKSSRESGARRSWSGRRMPAACWHAHRDVLSAIFAEYPDATIKTAMATYRGAEGFEDRYPGTADRNIGSVVEPAYMPDLCDCDE
jgi:hypothetical protein